MKIPFTLGAWLKDKSQKIETRDGRLVHDIWQVKVSSYTNNRKAEVCALIDGEENALVFFEGGRYLPTTKDTDSPFDLFIITTESELTSWQTSISGCLQKYGLLGCGAADRIAKECSAELFAIAREELVDDMQLQSDDEINEAYYRGRKDGKVDAWKGLPRWIDGDSPKGSAMIDISGLCGLDFIRRNGKLLRISNLEKLPGFNE